MLCIAFAPIGRKLSELSSARSDAVMLHDLTFCDIPQKWQGKRHRDGAILLNLQVLMLIFLLAPGKLCQKVSVCIL